MSATLRAYDRSRRSLYRRKKRPHSALTFAGLEQLEPRRLLAVAPPSVPDLVETSDSGVSNTDNITHVNAPAFWGTGEHHANVRVFANGQLVGQGIVGSDETHGGFDQIGRWEVTVEPLKYGQFTIDAEVEDLDGDISPPTLVEVYGVDASTDALYAFDLATGVARIIGPLHPDPTRFTTPVGMAIRRSDGVIFVHNNSPDSDHGLSILDPRTGRAAFIGGPGSSELAFDLEDNLYGLNSFRELSIIDQATGVPTAIGGPALPADLFALDFNPADGHLYGLTLAGDLLEIDLAGNVVNSNSLSPNPGTPGSLLFANGILYGTTIDDQLFEINPATGAVTNIRVAEQGPQGLGLARGASSARTVNIDIEGGEGDTTHVGDDGPLSTPGGTTWNGVFSGVNANNLPDEFGLPSPIDVVFAGIGGGTTFADVGINNLQDSGTFTSFQITDLSPGRSYQIAAYVGENGGFNLIDANGLTSHFFGNPAADGWSLPGTEGAGGDYFLVNNVVPFDLGGGVFGVEFQLDGAVTGVQIRREVPDPRVEPLKIVVDPYEPNDDLDEATILGSLPKITLNDVLLHNAYEIRDVPLEPGQVVDQSPPVESDALGSVDFAFNHTANTFDMNLFVAGLTTADLAAANQAEIRLGARGVVGPVILDLVADAGGTFVDEPGGIRMILDDAMFPEEHVDSLLRGNTYINVATLANPDGEVRGQLTGFDIDFFKYTAQDTGKLIVNAFSEDDITLRVRDVNDNILTTATRQDVTGGLDIYELAIPVVTQEEYFIEVLYDGDPLDDFYVQHVAIYDLEIENFPVPVPSGIHMDPASDTGMMHDDLITSDTTPTFFVQADLTDFFEMGIDILSPAEAEDMDMPGAAVQVFITNSDDGTDVVGYASQVGNSTTLFEFTPDDPLPDGVYFVSAAIQIIDGQEDADGDPMPANGRSQLSKPLWVMIDDTAPKGMVLEKFATELTGGQEVGPVDTLAGGRAKLMLNPARNRLEMTIELAGLDLDGNQTPGNPDDDVTGLHIHHAPAGANGPVVFGLIDPNSDLNGDLVIDAPAGRISSAWDLNEGDGTTLAAQLANLINRELYFNVHTTANPTGEIRGQIVPASFPTAGGGMLDMLQSSDTGMSVFDDTTSKMSPAFTGKAEANAKVRVIATDTATGTRNLVGQGVVGTDLTDGVEGDGFGIWEVTVEPLADGHYEITAEFEDLAGNISSAYVFDANGGLPAPIPDDGASHDFSVDVSYLLGNILDIDVRLDISHPATDELDIVLISPSGTTVELATDVGAGADFTNTTFDDDAAIAITAGANPFTGRFRPEGNLSDFDGEDPLGTWTLRIVDDTLGNVGELNAWSLCIKTDAGLPVWIDSVEPNTPHLELLDDTGHSDDDNITNDNMPDVAMTTHDPELEGTLYQDNLKYRIYDRYEDGAGNAQDEFLIYDSALDASVYTVNDPLDVFTALTLVTTQLPKQLGAPLPPAVIDTLAGLALADGFHNLKLEVEDRAGNISHDFLLTIEVDTTIVDPTIDLIASSDTGMFDDDNVTSKMSPAFAGIAEADTAVRVFAQRINSDGDDLGDPLLIGEGQVGSDLSDVQLAGTELAGVDVAGLPDDDLGLWEVTVEPLDDGVYDIFVETEDWAGNTSTSDDLRIEIDTIAPNTPFLDLDEESDTGRHDDDNITFDNTPTVSMTTHDANVPLHQVLFTDYLKFRIYDRFEGTTGPAMEEPEFLLYDSAQDAAVDAIMVALDGFTSLTLVTETLAAQFALPNPPNLAVNAAGELTDGIHNLKLEVEDRAGNISHDFLLDLLIDTEAPTGTVKLFPDSDTGIWGFPETMEDQFTNDKTPLLFGESEADALVRVEIDNVNGGTANGGTTVAVPLDGDDAFPPPDEYDGNYFLQTILNLEDGEHTISAFFRDVAGNESDDPEDAITIFVDTQGPRITNVTRGVVSGDPDIPDGNDFETSLFDPKPSGGPDPLIHSIVIHFSDLPDRTALFGDPERFGALFRALAEEEGNYQLIGDANGNIPILQVNVTLETMVGDGEPETAQVELVLYSQGDDGVLFTDDDLGAPLADDRFTLWVSDTIVDPAGNPLDGESGAQAPFEGNDVPNETPVIGPPDTIVNSPAVIFPTGDGEHGGDFHARFTVDSRAELATWAAGNVWADTNGNFYFDPNNTDFINRDVVYTQGFTSDDVFAGDFNGNGFDELASYGRVGHPFRWSIDTVGEDGDPEVIIDNPDRINGLPAAGEFTGDDIDELVLFTGATGLPGANTWSIYTFNSATATATRIAQYTTPSDMIGYPIVGDFDGDGHDDLATYADDVFQIDTYKVGGYGDGVNWTFRFGFIGVRERPVAADFNGDGIDDIGLWVPDRSGVVPAEAAEWYLLLSGNTSGHFDNKDGEPGISVIDRIETDGDQIDHPVSNPRDPVPARIVEFNPIPFGRDIYAQFGDEFALPVVGNFDPPVNGSVVSNPLGGHTNPFEPLDVNGDGEISPIDALFIINHLNSNLPSDVSQLTPTSIYLDVTADQFISPIDALMVFNYLNEQARVERLNAEAEADFGRQAIAAISADRLQDQVQGDPQCGAVVTREQALLQSHETDLALSHLDLPEMLNDEGDFDPRQQRDLLQAEEVDRVIDCSDDLGEFLL